MAALILGLKPMWLRHLNSCKVLEQDVGLITTQEDWLASVQLGTGQFARSALIICSDSDALHAVMHLYRRSSELESAVPTTAIIGPDGGRLQTMARRGNRCTVELMRYGIYFLFHANI